MNKVYLEKVNETFYTHITKAKLEAIFLNKPDFSKKTVSIQINYGSIDKVVKDEENEIVFHDGLAHFLEHMIFENTDRDIPSLFSKLNASVNAYTTTNKTVYYFSTVDDVVEPLKLLLDIVFSPSFDQQQIEKERAIITSEIMMYQDDVEQGLYYDTMKSLFQFHPVRCDVAGSVDEVRSITKEELMLAYAKFYHPKNAIITLSGEVLLDEIVDVIENYPFSENQINSEIATVVFEEEPVSPPVLHTLFKKDIHSHFVMVGYPIKIPPISLKDLSIKEFKYLLLFDNYFSKSSDFVEQLSNRKLINSTFDFSVTLDKSYGYLLFFAETKYPKKLVLALKEMLKSAFAIPLDEDRLIVQKQKIVGQFIQLFNSPSEASSFISEYLLKGLMIDELIDEIADFDVLAINDLKKDFLLENFVDIIYSY